MIQVGVFVKSKKYPSSLQIDVNAFIRSESGKERVVIDKFQAVIDDDIIIVLWTDDKDEKR